MDMSSNAHAAMNLELFLESFRFTHKARVYEFPSWAREG